MFSFIYQRRFQRILWQSIFAISVLWISFYFYRSMIEALASRDILPSFYFLDLSAGFDIGEKLISFSRTDTYARAFLVGILNTLCVSFFFYCFSYDSWIYYRYISFIFSPSLTYARSCCDCSYSKYSPPCDSCFF